MQNTVAESNSASYVNVKTQQLNKEEDLMKLLQITGAVAVATLLASCAPTQQSAGDTAAYLRKAAAAMGADNVKTLRYVGNGTGGQFGQAFVPGSHWPKVNYSRYERQLDFEKVFTSEQVRRSRAEPKGGGGVPLVGEAAFGGVASASHAWNLAGPMPVPRNAALTSRLHDLWITPHGVIKAAIREKATLSMRTQGGRVFGTVSFAVPGVMTATAFINENLLVERVESRLSDAVLGDISVVTTYSDYRDHGGVKFPARIEQTQEGMMVLSVAITEVTPNAEVNAAVPENVIKAAERVVAEKAADGVWFLAGGSHNSVAIEMSDHVILVEAPLGDERSNLVIQETKKLIPGKPIRFVVNSHNHFDHSGGLRAAVADGATVVVQNQSKSYFEKAFANPSRITPDLLAKSGKRAAVVGVGDNMTMKDAIRTVEIHHIKDSVHADTFLMVYLPKERLLIEADVYTPLPPNAPVPNPINALHLELVQNIERLKLGVDRILPLHGRIVPLAELHRTIGR
jgi:glyoxylase-like metal-dependent hydrolase (beta-lactamase superfamily II)